MSQETPTEHPHVIRQPGTCGGSPIVRGTRIPVRLIAFLWKAGDSVDDILRTYPHLQASWVHDTISYYLDHQQEIEQEIQDNEIENVVAQYGGVIDEKGVVRFPQGIAKDGQ